VRRICLGVIAGVHGVRGLVKIKSFTQVPADIGSYGPLENESGSRKFEIAFKSETKGVLLAAIAGVGDRDAAEALKGTKLYVAREALPAPEDEEEYYHADLIGLAAEDETGKALGTVVAVQNHGAGDILEIEDQAGTGLLVPFTKAAVPHIDLAGGRLTVSVPAEAPDD
jgi:16S rRNA processing protein RimM